MIGDRLNPYLKYGGVVVREYESAGHIIVDVAREADLESSPSGLFVRPGAEVRQVVVRCRRADCVMTHCSQGNERRLNQAVSRVIRAEGDYVLQVTAPRLAESADELALAVEAIRRAFWHLMGEVPGLDIYGGFLVTEWHREGVTRERALQAMRAKVRARFPLHLHAELPVVGVPASMVPAVERLANILLREALDADIYHGNLPMGDVDADMQAIRNGDKRDSVPYVRLVPTSEVGSERFKVGYLLKHLSPESPYNLRDADSAGLDGAAMIARHHEVNILLPGATKGYYAWAYPGSDGRARSFFSMASGWDKRAVMVDTRRRICGGEYVDAETGLREVWTPSEGLHVEVTHRGVTLSEVVSGRVVASSYLRLTLGGALHECRLEAEARLLETCEAIANRRDYLAAKALYAALCAVLSGLAQERAVTMRAILRGALDLLDMKKAAPSRFGEMVPSVDVQSLAQLPRPPPRLSAARLHAPSLVRCM